jgi:3-oxoacyl-[acyl-carrier protein] reductase
MRTLSFPKRILITGASRGIGRETGRLLARDGHRVVLAARDEPALHALAREIEAGGGRAEVVPLDLTDEPSVARAVEVVLAAGPCDVLVNNAGRIDQREFLKQPAAAQRAEMELNYWGAVRLTRALLPAFIRRRAGVVVNVSSLLGSVASPTTANYGATKAALEAWSLALRNEVARFGVRVSVFVAPHTDTETGRGVKLDRVVSPPVRYTAGALVRAIDRAPRKYTGSPVYRLLLWMARLFPAFMEARVAATARGPLMTE